MTDLIKGLAELAKTNLLEAQEAVLGYRSGPGIDITIRTKAPVDGDRLLVPVTKAGQAFLNKFYVSRTLPLAEMHKFHKLSHEWGLSINTVWEHEPL